MKVKNVNLEWFAIRHDFNTNEVVSYNVLYQDYPERISKDIRKGKINNYEELKDWLKRDLMYHYWSKCECEMVIGGLFHHSEEDLTKIDIWRQLEPNLDRIVEYIIREMQIDYKKGK